MTDRMLCPDCHKKMQRAGAGFSGSREVQIYRCGNRSCKGFGRRRMNSKEDYIGKEK